MKSIERMKNMKTFKNVTIVIDFDLIYISNGRIAFTKTYSDFTSI